MAPGESWSMLKGLEAFKTHVGSNHTTTTNKQRKKNHTYIFPLHNLTIILICLFVCLVTSLSKS